MHKRSPYVWDYEVVEFMIISPPRHIVWSTNKVDLSDPFQKNWYLQQVLTYGRAEDVRQLDFDEVAKNLEILNLPKDVYHLWKTYLGTRSHG
jgi:hypothetical protein